MGVAPTSKTTSAVNCCPTWAEAGQSRLPVAAYAVAATSTMAAATPSEPRTDCTLIANSETDYRAEKQLFVDGSLTVHTTHAERRSITSRCPLAGRRRRGRGDRSPHGTSHVPPFRAIAPAWS